MNEINKVIANNLREARLDAGKTRAEAANLLGIDDRTIGHYENGTREPKFEVLSNMSRIYNKPISYFFGEELKKEEVNNRLIDKIIYDLIDEEVLTEGFDFENLDEHHKDLLLTALKGHINKLRNKNRP